VSENPRKKELMFVLFLKETNKIFLLYLSIYHAPCWVKKLFKKNYGNMLKTAMSHVAPCPTQPRSPLPLNGVQTFPVI
jgi:hypothetical protein